MTPVAGIQYGERRKKKKKGGTTQPEIKAVCKIVYSCYNISFIIHNYKRIKNVRLLVSCCGIRGIKHFAHVVSFQQTRRRSGRLCWCAYHFCTFGWMGVRVGAVMAVIDRVLVWWGAGAWIKIKKQQERGDSGGEKLQLYRFYTVKSAKSHDTTSLFFNWPINPALWFTILCKRRCYGLSVLPN